MSLVPVRRRHPGVFIDAVGLPVKHVLVLSQYHGVGPDADNEAVDDGSCHLQPLTITPRRVFSWFHALQEALQPKKGRCDDTRTCAKMGQRSGIPLGQHVAGDY